MTRRVATAILLTVWALLIVGGAVTYAITRAILLDDLDVSIMARASTLPELHGQTGLKRPLEYARDRYLVRDDRGQTLMRARSEDLATDRPRVIGRAFATLGDGMRVRSLTLEADRPEPGRSSRRMTIVYSSPTATFDAALRRLAWSLAAFGALSGGGAAAVAVLVARRALLPLRQTATTLAAISENTLHHRVDAAALPSELKPVAARLNEMLQKLDLAFAQRRQFLADASHELRTPVAALVTALEVAVSRPRSAERLLQTMESCLFDARQLHHLVEQLLEQVRSENFQAAGPTERVNIDELLDRCVRRVAPLAQQRGIEIRRSPACDLVIRTQPQRVQSIVVNLLSNAIEHNDHPAGLVELVCEASGEGLAISVRDNGPGIASEHLPHLFEPFYRVHSTGDRGHLGLGLFLVNAHANALGAVSRIDSEMGVGTTVRVVLPLGSLDDHGSAGPANSAGPIAAGASSHAESRSAALVGGS